MRAGQVVAAGKLVFEVVYSRLSGRMRLNILPRVRCQPNAVEHPGLHGLSSGLSSRNSDD